MSQKKLLLITSIVINLILCTLTWTLVFAHLNIKNLTFIIMISIFCFLFLFNFIFGILQIVLYMKNKEQNLLYFTSGINIIFNIFIPIGVGFCIYLLVHESR